MRRRDPLRHAHRANRHQRPTHPSTARTRAHHHTLRIFRRSGAAVSRAGRLIATQPSTSSSPMAARASARATTPSPSSSPSSHSPLPGFGELFRMLSYDQIQSGAMLSRATGGIAGRTLLFALPGSTKAVELAMGEADPAGVEAFGARTEEVSRAEDLLEGLEIPPPWLCFAIFDWAGGDARCVQLGLFPQFSFRGYAASSSTGAQPVYNWVCFREIAGSASIVKERKGGRKTPHPYMGARCAFVPEFFR